MLTIKRKVEMNLPQLIEWLFRKRNLDKDTFTVEVEEEITEDTVIPRLVVRHRDTGFTLYENDYINNEFPLDSVQAFYILNDDLTLTLIWRDGRLVG